ncbi:calcium/sodium antiporter [Sedimentitalea sp. HM32M-2]|uniref:calcium/sodium antiporter n=1 Tax=Sedimentitalea sp. HM32M-2 TaxID=3351566 RepID=UPI003638903A
MLIAGFAGLVVGGDLLVRGAVVLARRLGISPMVIGLTLVGFGTSMPELVTSLQAALAGSPGIAVGNVVGSNTANILLIMGMAALIAPMAVQRAAFQRDGLFLVLATAACLAVVLSGSIGRAAGMALIAGLGVYMGLTLYLDRASTVRQQGAGLDLAAPEPGGSAVWRALGQFLAGLILTIVAARLLVAGAISLAAGLGVSEAVIGVSIVAVGTSMPELITSVVAARQRQADIAFGNVLGSNIFNILGILGVTAAVHPLTVPAQILALDIWVMTGATALLVAFAWSGWRISRGEGAAMLALYGLYLAWMVHAVT